MTARPTTAYNFTIDDASPLIKYEPAGLWDDNVSLDVNLPNYVQDSYHYSINATATASLNFTGTGVWLIGGRRAISGAYSVQIDNRPAQSFPANVQSTTQYQVVLGGANGLPFGEHTIVVKNLSTDSRQPVLDIDAFLVETAAGNGSGETFSGPRVVDDASAGITYSANGWTTTSRVASPNTQFSSGTVHESGVNGGNVEFSFDGQGVGIIGAVGPRNGNFRVELDGKVMGEMSARAANFHPLTPIWFASGLSAGQHTVKLTNTGSNGDALTIDSYQVFQATAVNVSPSLPSASVSSASSSGAPASSSVLTPAFPTPSANKDTVSYSRTSSAPLGLIIGSSVGALVFLCLIGLGILFYIRLRRKNTTLQSAGGVASFTQPPPDSVMVQVPADETRWSTATAVDVEAGLRTAEKAERTEKTERTERTGGWLRRPTKDRSNEPSTPPLPLQNYTPSPATSLAPGPNPILGTGGYVASNDRTGSPVPSGSRAVPAPAPAFAITPTRAPLAGLPIIPTVAITSPKPPPRTPLPPPPVVIGLPPRGRQQADSGHGRTPSVGAGPGGPSGSRSLTSHEIRRSRSAQAMKDSTRMEADKEVLLPPASGRFNQPQARESNTSFDFDLSAYTDPLTPTLMSGASAVPVVPSIPREYAPYTSRPESVRSSLESARPAGPGQRRRATGMI